MPRADDETLAIPERIRAAVDERDGYFCRVCGEYLGIERRALHHIIYGGDARGMGGRRQHRVEEIITVGWLFEQDCHTVVHRRKHYWQDVLLQVAQTPGVTALQLVRWNRLNAR